MNSIGKLHRENTELTEDIFDLQSRSMPDNLLFCNVDEEDSFETRKSENCTGKVLTLCDNELQMEDSANNIKIDCAHRVGHYEHSEKRPIIVKFNLFGDKTDCKKRGHLTNKPYSVGDQFPKVIQERRRKLIPYLVQARHAFKRTSLVYGSLYIDR